MPAHINYEDDLFVLSALIKNLRLCLTLDADPDFFLDKFTADLFFIDRTLKQLHASVTTNSYLIRRMEYARDLLRVERVFLDLLSAILAGEIAITRGMSADLSGINACSAEFSHAQEEIVALLSTGQPDEEPAEDLISSDEYRLLLHGEDVDASTG